MGKLDEAKLNLKSVLERLEKAIDNNLKSNTPVNQSEISALKSALDAVKAENNRLKFELEDKISEIAYLREENFKIQAQLGEEQEKSMKLSVKNSEASRRVDLIIEEFRSYISNHV